MPKGINRTVSEESGDLSWPLAHLGHTFHRCWWGMMDRLIAQVFYWLYYQAHMAYSTTWVLMPSTPFCWSHSCLSDGNLGMLIPSCFPRRNTWTQAGRKHTHHVLQQAVESQRNLACGSPAEHTFPVVHSTTHARSHGRVLHRPWNPQQPHTPPAHFGLSCLQSRNSKMLISKTHYLKTDFKNSPKVSEVFKING